MEKFSWKTAWGSPTCFVFIPGEHVSLRYSKQIFLLFSAHRHQFNLLVLCEWMVGWLVWMNESDCTITTTTLRISYNLYTLNIHLERDIFFIVTTSVRGVVWLDWLVGLSGCGNTVLFIKENWKKVWHCMTHTGNQVNFLFFRGCFLKLKRKCFLLFFSGDCKFERLFICLGIRLTGMFRFWPNYQWM